MRRIIGIGETIMDIIFKDQKPQSAVPGGSVFNGIASLAKMGLDVSMITEVGCDKVGDIIMQFMKDNGVNTDGVCRFSDGRSALSLAWLNEKNDAQYMFYKDYPKARLDVEWPVINKDDIVMMGSYFVLNPVLREKVLDFLKYAKQCGAIIYYDFNFRSTHRAEAVKLYSSILENLEFADIVRGSNEDFENMFGYSDPEKVYKNEISFYCKNMIFTSGAGSIYIKTPSVTKEYEVASIPTVSTIGAGDNFNAGVVYGLVKGNVGLKSLDTLDEGAWDSIVKCGIDLASDVCQSLSNSVSDSFAERYSEFK
jgi:fructokinase